MHIPVEIVVFALSCFSLLQAWTLKEVVSLKTKVARLEERLRVAGETEIERRKHYERHSANPHPARS